MAEINPHPKTNTPKVNHPADLDRNPETEKSQVGTVLGVGLVGAVILISYFTLYGLYLARM